MCLIWETSIAPLACATQSAVTAHWSVCPKQLCSPESYELNHTTFASSENEELRTTRDSLTPL
eukprot:1200602-Amphidinium_carterae.1